jgi:hypothetical protein
MYMPKILWSLYFMQIQGFDVETVELYQDNKSTQLLVENGRFSSGKKTKHIRAKFFSIKVRVGNGEVRIVHWPTKEMGVDVLTKQLKGGAFRVIQDKLMNCDVEYEEKESKIRQGKTGRNQLTVNKPSPVTGRMTTRSPTQTLQKCAGQSQNRRQTQATDRLPVRVSRIQR